MSYRFLVAGALICSSPAATFGGTILSQTYTWADRYFGQNVQVQVDVLDNFRGDYSRAEWRYTLQNIDFTGTTPYHSPYIDYSKGLFTVFYLPFNVPLPLGPGEDPFSSFYAPDGWITVYNYLPGHWELINLDEHLSTGRGNGVAWVGGQDYPCLPACGVGPQIGIPPGSSAVFGFAMKKPVMISETPTPSNVYQAWPYLFTMAYDAGKYVPEAGMGGTLLTPGVPEPFTFLLVGGGLIGITFIRRYRSRV